MRDKVALPAYSIDGGGEEDASRAILGAANPCHREEATGNGLPTQFQIMCTKDFGGCANVVQWHNWHRLACQVSPETTLFHRVGDWESSG